MSLNTFYAHNVWQKILGMEKKNASFFRGRLNWINDRNFNINFIASNFSWLFFNPINIFEFDLVYQNKCFFLSYAARRMRIINVTCSNVCPISVFQLKINQINFIDNWINCSIDYICSRYLRKHNTLCNFDL